MNEEGRQPGACFTVRLLLWWLIGLRSSTTALVNVH